jgi:beta-mannosidase
MFHGIDTVAQVFVNGRSVGTAANMFIEHEFDLADALRPGTNELVVHLDSPRRYAEQFEYPPFLDQVWDDFVPLRVRKPAHMFGWDITPRVVSAGLHRTVQLLNRGPWRIEDWYLRTSEITADQRSAKVDLAFTLSRPPRDRAVQVRLRGMHEASGQSFEADAYPDFVTGRITVQVPDPWLWQPRNYGDPHLYDVELSLLVDGEEVDRHEQRFGIRMIEHEFDVRPPPDGKFRFRVNGRPILVMGTNWVPLDPLHARDADRLAPALKELWESGVNAVRCWGGNLYEDTPFFEFCDTHGILVWQDFALACGRYPADEQLTHAVRDEATAIVRKLRNHACLMIWSGSNENDMNFVSEGVDPGTDPLTREVLPRVVQDEGWRTPYIPGSPAVSADMARRQTLLESPEQHLWGPRSGFKTAFITNPAAMFVGEIGYHGMPAAASLDQFLPAGHRDFDPADPIWILHESDHRKHPRWRYSRLELAANQVAQFFGTVDTKRRDRFLPASQIVQAEAYKFYLESTRLMNDERSGIMWWNLLDSWPQVADSVVDYYFRRKLAFYYLRRSQQPVCVVAAETEGWTRDIVVVNDGIYSGPIDVTVRSLTRDELLVDTRMHTVAGENTTVGVVPASPLPDCLLLRWTTPDGEVSGGNHYLASSSRVELDAYLDGYFPAIAALDDEIDPKFLRVVGGDA